MSKIEEKECIDELNKFLIDVKSMEILEKASNKINIFEILKITSAEIKHSNMLAWLLNPRETHGLDELVLKKMLQRYCIAYEKTQEYRLNTIDIALMEFDDIIIKREWNNIDVLILSENNKIVIALENKIKAKESKNQLGKYYKVIQEEFKAYRKIFMFLTLDGIEARDSNNWKSMSYRDLLLDIESSVEIRNDSISSFAKEFINHYTEGMRRRVFMDDEISKLCTKIYYKHQKALDLIFEYKPDLALEINKEIEKILRSDEEIIVDNIIKTKITFTSKVLEGKISLDGNGEWNKSNRMLLYEIQINDKIDVRLIIGPVKDVGKIKRERIYNFAKGNKELFKGIYGKLTPKYTEIYAMQLVDKQTIENKGVENIIEEFKERWIKFKEKEVELENELLKIELE